MAREALSRPWFTMLQDEEAEAEAAAPADDAAAGGDAAGGGEVVFPDDYPNSVKHFLMLGAIGMLIGAIVFISLNFLRAKRSTAHSVSDVHPDRSPPRPWAAEARRQLGACAGVGRSLAGRRGAKWEEAARRRGVCRQLTVLPFPLAAAVHRWRASGAECGPGLGAKQKAGKS
jgi:hypothetical protein